MQNLLFLLIIKTYITPALAEQAEEEKKTLNRTTEMIGRSWFVKFLQRHLVISTRKPKNTSAAKANGFNKGAVNDFFKHSSRFVSRVQFPPRTRVYNVDETGISVVPKSRCNVLARRGTKQVGCISSAERGAPLREKFVWVNSCP